MLNHWGGVGGLFLKNLLVCKYKSKLKKGNEGMEKIYKDINTDIDIHPFQKNIHTLW